jgi:hypothetical protein
VLFCQVLVAAVLVFASALARAAPATVRAGEAPARSAPLRDAPVLHVYGEGAAVSVSEVVEQGFRRIRLPDGGVGFVEDGQVRVDAAPQGPAIVAAAVAVPPRDLSPRVYVRGLDHLTVLVKADADLAARARRLERRRRAAIATGVVGFGASLALTAAGFLRMNQAFDQASGAPPYDAPGSAGTGLVISGLAVCAVTPLVMWAVLPKREDVLDVVNGWNARHPGQPFELGFGEMHHAGHEYRY